jgi:hypothetical protein
VPQDAELEVGFHHWLTILSRLVAQLGTKLTFYTVGNASENFKEQLKKRPSLLQSDFLTLPFWENLEEIASILMVHPDSFGRGEDLLLVVSARVHALSYTKVMERLPRILSDGFEPISFVILFPEKNLAADTEGVSQQFVG